MSMPMTAAVLAAPPMALMASPAAARACNAPAKKKRGLGALLSDSAERPCLVCWGKLNQYAASDSWVEVF